MELRRRAIKRWVPCDDIDLRLKIPHSAKVKCGFRTTSEECLYDSGLNGLQNRASSYNSIQYEVEKTYRSYSTKSFQNHWYNVPFEIYTTGRRVAHDIQ